MVEQSLRAEEESGRAHVDGLDGVHLDEVCVDAEGVPALGGLDLSLGRNHRTRGIQEMSVHETCGTKSHVCFGAVATRGALSAYDAAYLELSASTTSPTTSQSPAASASWRNVHPARVRAAGFAPPQAGQ